MDSWESAKNVADLQFLFKSTPPPLGKVELLPEEPRGDVGSAPVRKEKSNGWIYAVFALLVICSIVVFTYQQIQISSLQNEITIKADSMVYYQRLVDSRETEIAEMKQEELMRQKEERRTSFGKELEELNNQLKEEQAKLDKINEFQIFRSSEEKVQQVTTQQNIVDALVQKIETLKREQAENE